MNVLTGVRDYLRGFPGLEALEIDQLDAGAGAVCLHPVAGEPVRKEYLDGSVQEQVLFEIWVRRGYGGADQTRQESLSALQSLARRLEQETRAGFLPVLGDGKRAWSLRAADTPSSQLLQEDGLLVDQLTLKLIYFMEG